MKNVKYIALIMCLLISPVINAQLSKVKPIAVATNYYKTTHLIFPTNIKYFNSFGDLVAVDQPENVPFVLRIKANEKDFTEKTSVSVATADGKFYDFVVSYSENMQFTNLYLENMRFLTPEKIGVDEKAQTHLLFPESIKYVDIGDECVISSLAENTRNILWIQAAQEKFEADETNVSVVTENNEFFTYNVHYTDKPVSSYYAVAEMEKEEEQVILLVNEFTDNDRRRIMEKVDRYSRRIYSLGEKKDGILFSVINVFIHKNMILFRCEVENVSSIPYNIEYTKFNIIDKKKQKLTASQEVEQEPIFLEGYKSYIQPNKTNVFTIGFETFTIPDDKFLRIELNEKNGGRHVNFLVTNKDITDGQTF